jgi:hypothetical protein
MSQNKLMLLWSRVPRLLNGERKVFSRTGTETTGYSHAKDEAEPIAPPMKSLKMDQSPSQLLMAPDCNPSYSGDRDQEDVGSEPGWANSS